MDAFTAGIASYGYAVLFLVVFLETIGFPIPAALALLIAGAAAARGAMHPALLVGGSIASMMTGDILMFTLGRHTGWWLLTLLCRLSLNPESCILRSAGEFHRRGRKLIVIAKFIPGINTMAPPLAGSMKMRALQFLHLDFYAAVLYAGAYLTIGYLGSDALKYLTRGYQAFGSALTWALVAAFAGYLGMRAWLWQKSRAWRSVPHVLPADVASALEAGTAIVYDVRSHGYYDPGAVRIRGSRRIDPNTLPEGGGNEIPAGKLIYLYCT